MLLISFLCSVAMNVGPLLAYVYRYKKCEGRVGGGEAQPWKMGISRWKCFTPVTKLFQLPMFLKTDL